MSIGPLFSELALSSESSLFSRIGTVLLYVLLLVGGIVSLIAFIKLWNERYKEESKPNGKD